MTLRIKSFQSKTKRFTINDAKNICRLKHSWFALEQQQTHFVHICHSVIIIIIWHQGPKVAKRSGKKVQIMSGKKKDGDGEWTEAQRLRLQIPKYISVCRDCMRGIILSGRCAFVVRRFFECLWHNVCVCVRSCSLGNCGGNMFPPPGVRVTGSILCKKVVLATNHNRAKYINNK